MEDNKIRIGITQGDINGVGYEVILKTFSDPTMLELCTPIIYGSPKVAAYHRKALDIQANFSIVNSATEAGYNRLSVVNCTDDEVKVEFSKPDPEAGKAALVMGCVGVTEGAIPFAAADPLRVIPSIMVGSACGTVTAALFGAQCYAGWGGLIVLPVVEGKLGYIAAVAVGAVVTAVCVNVLKSLARKKVSQVDQKEDDLDLDFEMN